MCVYVCVFVCNHSRRQLEQSRQETVEDLNILFIIHGLNSDKSIQLNIWNFHKPEPLICYLVLIDGDH